MIAVVRRLARVAFVLLAAGVTLGVNAAPAWAHGVSGLQPTNYRTTVRGVSPAVAGISVRAVDLGGRLELSNRTPADVVVLGYEREPYLRVGPAGAFENLKSPAVFLNRTTVPSAAAPKRYDASAAPVWHRISRGHRVSWHDHRAHWMGGSAPPDVSRSPSRRHMVIRGWQVPAVYDGHGLTFTGDVLWIPGPSPWPWVAGAGALAAVVVIAARTRAWRLTLIVALALLVSGEALHVAGLWGASTATTLSKAGSSLYSVAGCLVGLGALAMLRRRDPYDATPIVLIAAVFLLIAGGFADVTSLTRSQLPTTLPDTLARGVVTAALGLGAGLVVAAAWRLRRPVAEGSSTSASRPAPRGRGAQRGVAAERATGDTATPGRR